MYNKDQLEEELRMHTKNAIFERDFQIALSKALAEKQKETAASYAEKVNREDYTVLKQPLYKPGFSIAGDDKYGSLIWASLMKDAAHYYDYPFLDDER